MTYRNCKISSALTFCRNYYNFTKKFPRTMSVCKNVQNHLNLNPPDRKFIQSYNSSVKPKIDDKNQNPHSFPHNEGFELVKLCNESPTEENLKSFKKFLVEKTEMVSKVEDCERIIKEILEPTITNEAQSSPAVSIDCEGVHLGKTGNVIILQMYDPQRGNIYFFDLMTEPKMAPILKELLISDKVLKIIHDCKNDSANLYNEFGIHLQNIFDTQAAHYMIKFCQESKENQDSSSIMIERFNQRGLTTLCQIYGSPSNPFKDLITRKMYSSNQNFWRTRPLTKKMIVYAATDVLVLPNLYLKLQANLEKVDSDHENTVLNFNDECKKRVFQSVRKCNRFKLLQSVTTGSTNENFG